MRSFEAQNPPCGVGVGLAFDGFQLLVSCYVTNVLSGVSPVDGSLIRDYPIAGVNGIGALSFDRVGNRIWICDYPGERVLTADLFTGTSQVMFQSNGCFDGLAYDPTDDTVWAGPDVGNTITHYKTDGTVLGQLSVAGKIGACGKSGIAAGAHELFVANNGCSQIYRMGKDGSNASLVGSYPARLEDLECDDVNFPGTSVIWSKDAYDRVLNAFDVGAIDCGINAYRDSDADGLSDTWESQGADIDGNGTIDLDLPAMGADPLHKDLFVEIDWLTKDPTKIGPISFGGYAHPPSQSSVSRVVNAFKSWPVPNPDGVNGINLHMDAGTGSVMNPATGAKWGNRSRANAIVNGPPADQWPNDTYWSTLDTMRENNVDTARRGIFHYVLYVDHISCDGIILQSCVTGISRNIPGHDLLIARGDIGTDLQEAVTLAHELGHNLGLGHGGRERSDDPNSRYVNEKANYLSIMNYFYSNTGLRTHAGTDGIIAYSSREHDTLLRDNLDETAGLNPDPFGHFDVTYRCPNGDKKNADSWTSIDWNCDSSIANGSSNGKLQDPDEVAEWNVNALTVLGSQDYTHLYFWGTGATWDARNQAIKDKDQPGTAEPTVPQAKADGVWWPDLSVQTPPQVQLAIYPNTGSVDIPLTLANPGAVDFTITAELQDADTRFTLANPGLPLPKNTSQTLHLAFNSGNVEPGHTYRAVISYSHSDFGNLGAIELIVSIPTSEQLGANACTQARTARDTASLATTQIPALDAFLRIACGDTQSPSPPASPFASASDAPGTGGGLPVTGGRGLIALITSATVLLTVGALLLIAVRSRNRRLNALLAGEQDLPETNTTDG